MVRYVILLLAIVSLSFPAVAKGEFDPDGKGYIVGINGEISKLSWAPIQTNCTPCEALVDSYNEMMSSLFDLRYQKKVLESDLEQAKRSEQHVRKLVNGSGNKGVNYDEQTIITTSVAYQEKMDMLKTRISSIEAQIGQLEDVTKNLRSQIQRCEKQCTNSEYKKVIEQDDTVSMGLPFAWRGPYPEVCAKCAKLAARLNELPDLAYAAMGKIEKAKADKLISESEIANARADFDISATTSGKIEDQETLDKLGIQGKSVYEKTIRENEKRIEAADRIIAANEADLAEIKRNFEQTLALYNKCTPTCPKETGAKDPVDDGTALALGGDYSKDLKGCGLSYTPDAIVIGSNSQYGTGAATKDKVKGAATGAAMGALGGLLGGRGISLGGGHSDKGGGMQAIDPVDDGGNGGQEGPKLDSNPIKGAPTSMFKWEGMYIGAQAGYTNDGLVVNQEIKDSPDGNSTFHSMWLENPKGEKILPARYYLYSIYMDHKLRVWWTYDHWTNGVHDDHDEGEEVSTWRTYHGDFFKSFGGEQGIPKSMWYQSGYNTAVKGVKNAGALFAISPSDLSGCGAYLTTHYTLPSKDPVVTQPMVLHLFNDVPADPKYDSLGKKVPVGMELFNF